MSERDSFSDLDFAFEYAADVRPAESLADPSCPDCGGSGWVQTDPWTHDECACVLNRRHDDTIARLTTTPSDGPGGEARTDQT